MRIPKATTEDQMISEHAASLNRVRFTHYRMGEESLIPADGASGDAPDEPGFRREWASLNGQPSRSR